MKPSCICMGSLLAIYGKSKCFAKCNKNGCRGILVTTRLFCAIFSPKKKHLLFCLVALYIEGFVDFMSSLLLLYICEWHIVGV